MVIVGVNPSEPRCKYATQNNPTLAWGIFLRYTGAIVIEKEFKMDRKTFEEKFDYYASVGASIGANSIWSIYEVDNLETDHPFAGATEVTYHPYHLDGGSITVPLEGSKWVDLWASANDLIITSGDTHHLFVENFEVSDDGKTLNLWTGS